MIFPGKEKYFDGTELAGMAKNRRARMDTFGFQIMLQF